MVPITQADEDLFGTAIAAARLGRIGAIIERLRTRYDEDWDDPAAGLPYALAMLALLQSSRGNLPEQLDITELVETLGDLLYHEPDHWLGRYLRIHIRALLPTDGEYRRYMVAERVRAAEDARELIERQSRTAWQPWFTCSYILAAWLAWQSDPEDRDQVAALVTAAAAAPCVPVRFPSLGSVMCSAFLWCYDKPDLPERDTVGALAGLIFPDHPTVRRDRTDRMA